MPIFVLMSFGLDWRVGFFFIVYKNGLLALISSFVRAGESTVTNLTRRERRGEGGGGGGRERERGGWKRQERVRETDRQINRQAGRQTGRQAGNQADRQAGTCIHFS